MTKTTLRLPEPVIDALRERSQAEGRSVNDIAVDALLRGLGKESPNGAVRTLGSLLARPAVKGFDRARMREERLRFGLRGKDFSAELDWARGSE